MSKQQSPETKTILTPTPRLARAEKHRISEARLAEGAQAWHAPEVLSFSARLGKLRTDALMAGAIDRVPVSASQVRLLWQQVIDTDVFVGEPRVHALAERAWRTIHEYQLQHPRDWPEPLLSEDSRQFREWVARFEQLCQQRGVIDEWRFGAELPGLIAGHRLALPDRIELNGFELPPTPLQVSIFEALESAGVELLGLEQSPANATPEIPAMTLHQYTGTVGRPGVWALPSCGARPNPANSPTTAALPPRKRRRDISASIRAIAARVSGAPHRHGLMGEEPNQSQRIQETQTSDMASAANAARLAILGSRGQHLVISILRASCIRPSRGRAGSGRDSSGRRARAGRRCGRRRRWWSPRSAPPEVTPRGRWTARRAVAKRVRNCHVFDMDASSSTKHVSLVATPDIILGTLAGLLDVFGCFKALGWFDEALPRHPPFTVDIVAPGHAPRVLSGGVALAWTRSLRDVTRTDLVLLPSLMVTDGEWHTGRHPELVGWLRAMHEAGAELCSACSGSLLLAETGLLDGRTATTHWAYADTFRRHFPRVTLQLEKALIVEGERHEIVMSGASSSWHDLALYLVARHLGTAAAQAVANFFAFDLHGDSMEAYAVFIPRLDHGDAAVEHAQHWIARHLACHSPVERMAACSDTAERSFKRRFLKATGYTPIHYVQAMRLNEAKRLLERTRQPIDEIAWAVGYEDPAFFRRLFKRRVGVTPGTHRRKFSVPGEP